MSFRPAISIYAGDQIADVRLYPEWSLKGLFTEALAMGALFEDVRSAGEYRRVRRNLLKEVFLAETRAEETEEKGSEAFLHELEEMSDLLLIVDLEKGVFYRDGCSADRLLNGLSFPDLSNDEGYSELLSRHSISFRNKASAILETIYSCNDLKALLSRETEEMLDSRIGRRSP